MWVLLNGMLYNLNHVVSITLPKGSEDMYYFTMIFKDGSDERFSYFGWNECEKQYRSIFSVIISEFWIVRLLRLFHNNK